MSEHELGPLPKRAYNSTPWGSAEHQQRNLQLARAVLQGATLAAAGKDAGLTPKRARQIVEKCCRAAWRQDESLRRDFPGGHLLLSSEELRALSDRILPHLEPANKS